MTIAPGLPLSKICSTSKIANSSTFKRIAKNCRYSNLTTFPIKWNRAKQLIIFCWLSKILLKGEKLFLTDLFSAFLFLLSVDIFRILMMLRFFSRNFFKELNLDENWLLSFFFSWRDSVVFGFKHPRDTSRPICLKFWREPKHWLLERVLVYADTATCRKQAVHAERIS